MPVPSPIRARISSASQVCGVVRAIALVPAITERPIRLIRLAPSRSISAPPGTWMPACTAKSAVVKKPTVARAMP